MSTSSAAIAAELREQISAGRLRPGDRLPSAREIVRTWNVAIATASRVHALLRSQGLATPVPGVGTVVAGATSVGRPDPRTHHPKRRLPPGSGQRSGQDSQELVAERIVAAGVAIADVEGVDSLSIRRVAHALRMSPTTLYRHHSSRGRLLVRMTDRALGEWSAGEQVGGWRDRLISGHRELWQVFRRHRWLAPQLSITRPRLVPAALQFAEWAIRTLTEAGLSTEEAFEIHILLFTQVRGVAILLEPEVEAEAITGVDADTWVDERLDVFRELSSRGDHTALQSLVGSGYTLDLDRAFERGLILLVDGIASQSGQRP